MNSKQDISTFKCEGGCGWWLVAGGWSVTAGGWLAGGCLP